MSEYWMGIIAFLLPLASVFFIQPSVAKVALAKNFTAEPEKRFPGLPLLSLGGVSMFIGISLAVSLACSKPEFTALRNVLAAMIVMLFSGFLIDSKMSFSYFRFLAKILAAALIIIPFYHKQDKLFPEFSPIMNSTLEMAFLIGFIFLYHHITVIHRTIFLSLAMLNSAFFGYLFWGELGLHQWSILGIALSGCLLGIIGYSRYAFYLQKPLPLIGHTGIYITGLILSTLWLNFLCNLNLFIL
ncbi:MAG: hypothetical protein ACK5JD_15145 [Mangrovibacterium sp.]